MLELKIKIEGLKDFIESLDGLTEAMALVGAGIAYKKNTPKAVEAAAELVNGLAEKEKAAGAKKAAKEELENKPKTEKVSAQTLTLEMVRAKLAELSQNGKQAEVKALITKYGAEKLSDIPEDKYSQLMKEAEEL